MRIAGLAFARLRGPNKTYALLLNRGRLKHNGERILSPIGGGLTLSGPGQRMMTGLGARFEGKPSDMQFWVPDSRVTTVVDWFRTASYREHSVLREAREELGDETGILTNARLHGLTERFSHFARHNDDTKRPVADKRTAYLIDVFDLFGLDADAKQALVAASRKPLADRWLYFVTPREIERGRTRDGAVIGPICQKLLPR